MHVAGRQRGDRSRIGAGKSYLGCCLAKRACKMRGSARYVRMPDPLMELDEPTVMERSDQNSIIPIQ
ncbi:hypothetical protein DMP06_07525 [Slackia equolifaciens]|uniref:Uncharacterized protein n=1 Tax=Slackia equolifaciens TaxID=498718 RepID=A0A3N0AX59_9ACTN|nr:hypothetical protein [Slackia equolifaciens]RNL39461.1 hypothetical protein DMP06_07525 [Slackia equolifaciens]